MYLTAKPAATLNSEKLQYPFQEVVTIKQLVYDRLFYLDSFIIKVIGKNILPVFQFF